MQSLLKSVTTLLVYKPLGQWTINRILNRIWRLSTIQDGWLAIQNEKTA